jgi:hypothetical protein
MSATTVSSSALPPESVARVRVFLPTFRRRELLPRAVQSLREQTMPDWICELHNDDPGDPFPAELVRRLGDPRILLRTHERNLGAGTTFNLFFHPTPEPFSSLLEDDNWWDPDFLRTMLAAAEAHPEATILWANMRVWQQEADGGWRDTGRLLHPYREGDQPRAIPWGQPTQVQGALHSNGAALRRSRPGQSFTVPNIPFAAVETFRERTFPHPLILVPQPLAHYSLTVSSARSDDHAEWACMQTMFAATFLKHAHYSPERLAALWAAARAETPPATAPLLLALLVEPAGRSRRAPAQAGDWLLLARGLIRRPTVLRRVLASRRQHRDWWEFLDRATAARFAEARATV